MKHIYGKVMTKNIIIVVLLLLVGVLTGCQSTKVIERDYSYEAYCDSIWKNNPNYYMDVLVETDEYCTYIEKCGIWWKE